MSPQSKVSLEPNYVYLFEIVRPEESVLPGIRNVRLHNKERGAFRKER